MKVKYVANNSQIAMELNVFQGLGELTTDQVLKLKQKHKQKHKRVRTQEHCNLIALRECESLKKETHVKGAWRLNSKENEMCCNALHA